MCVLPPGSLNPRTGPLLPMFDVPLDAWYTWLGLATVSIALVGVAGSLPIAPPPDAAAVADTVDRVGSASYPTTAEHPLGPAVDAVRLGAARIGLRGDQGAAHAAFAFGPVTPVSADGPLERVLLGTPPSRVFDSPAAFDRAAERARSATPRWGPAQGLTIRRVIWEGVDVILVGV